MYLSFGEKKQLLVRILFATSSGPTSLFCVLFVVVIFFFGKQTCINNQVCVTYSTTAADGRLTHNSQFTSHLQAPSS